MSAFLQEGDVFELMEGDTVYMRIPHHFIYANEVGEFGSTSKTHVTIGSASFPTKFMLGRWICIATEMTGGGTGHGSHDIYPNGHLVKALHSVHTHLRCSFYQSGSFRAMIPDRKSLGRAQAEWKVSP